MIEGECPKATRTLPDLQEELLGLLIRKTLNGEIKWDSTDTDGIEARAAITDEISIRVVRTYVHVQRAKDGWCDETMIQAFPDTYKPGTRIHALAQELCSLLVGGRGHGRSAIEGALDALSHSQGAGR